MYFDYTFVMKRKSLREALFRIGYSKDMVKSLLVGRSRPSVEKMFKLEDEFGIPVHAWRDIKSYLQSNDAKEDANNAR